MDNLFQTADGTSTQTCDEDSGSDLTPMTPPELCDLIAEAQLNPNLYYARLRQLLGRYFATHGPRQLPDCIDCLPSELISMEAELRLAMSTTSETGEMASESSDFRSVALAQYNQLGGSSIVYYPDLAPCGTPVENVPIYTETYKTLVKQIALIELDENDISELTTVAQLCLQEYGEVVTWARGLLNLYDVRDFDMGDCEQAETEGRSRQVTEELLLNISPVPAENYIDVRISSATDSEGTFTITDISGRVLSKQNRSEKLTRIETAYLENGMYYLVYNNENGVFKTSSFIIQR